MPTVSSLRVVLAWTLFWHVASSAGELPAAPPRSHAPMRTPPEMKVRERATGTAHFVDPAQGSDASDGSESLPWKTLKHSVRQLRPGSTLYLRGGTYYERPSLSRSGTPEAPITIRAFPGETAVIDGGLREFFDSPATAWEPLADGAPGEFVSTQTYFDQAERHPPRQFLPAAWEPLFGIEDERPRALGHFGDSMVPLHGYRFLTDLRAANEFWIDDKKDPTQGMYCGPGLWFNRDTGRIHCRLAHHTLPGLGDRAYRVETDPRKLLLVVSVGFGSDVMTLCGVKHVRLYDLTFRGATGSPMLDIYGCEGLELDRLTVFGGFPALLIDATQKLKVSNSVFRGLAAPWTGRAHMKYRGTASYQIVLRNDQPLNAEIEFAHCEFTDDHDFAFLRFAKNLRMHHCYVDNFNDDGFECGPKLRDHSIFLYQNRIGACLGVFQQHEMDKDESPVDHTPGTGVFAYRNVIDLRGGLAYQHPKEPDPEGTFLWAEGKILGDHGSPTYPVMRFYHNTVLREGPNFRGAYLFDLAPTGMRQTERDVFNNILVQRVGAPGVGFVAVKEAGRLREGGNLLWSIVDGPKTTGDIFAKFRASPLFEQSKQQYAPGWTTQDRFADPKFVGEPASRTAACDLRLRPDSPAVDAGLPIPADWPDSMRGLPHSGDIGALPLGADAWGVGVDGRIPLCQ